jgi:hypothetical protein
VPEGSKQERGDGGGPQESLLSAAIQRLIFLVVGKMPSLEANRHDLARAPPAMRTVWLALLCLTGLATIVAARIGMAPLASANASAGVPVTKPEVAPPATLTDGEVLSWENLTAGTELHNNALAKADKLEVLHKNDVTPEVKIDCISRDRITYNGAEARFEEDGQDHNQALA